MHPGGYGRRRCWRIPTCRRAWARRGATRGIGRQLVAVDLQLSLLAHENGSQAGPLAARDFHFQQRAVRIPHGDDAVRPRSVGPNVCGIGVVGAQGPLHLVEGVGPPTGDTPAQSAAVIIAVPAPQAEAWMQRRTVREPPASGGTTGPSPFRRARPRGGGKPLRPDEVGTEHRLIRPRPPLWTRSLPKLLIGIDRCCVPSETPAVLPRPASDIGLPRWSA